jgi:glycosyltransferase involved in cell wall biosynthesis
MIVIVPTARSERIPHVVRQWRAQTYTAAELCICPAPDMAACIPSGVTVLQPTDTIGEARNEGLWYARARGHTWAVFWDDDNYYGPDYLAEVARESQDPAVDVLSKGLAFVRHDSGLWLYSPPLRFFPGHSTSVRVSAAAQFPALSLAEDVAWSQRMLTAGARVRPLSPWGLVYDRRDPDGHAYDASDVEFLRAHGPACGPFLAADDSSTDTPGPWTREVLGAPKSASDEAVFRSLERRAALRLGRARG